MDGLPRDLIRERNPDIPIVLVTVHATRRWSSVVRRRSDGLRVEARGGRRPGDRRPRRHRRRHYISLALHHHLHNCSTHEE
jgi:hypothetical protein